MVINRPVLGMHHPSRSTDQRCSMQPLRGHPSSVGCSPILQHRCRDVPTTGRRYPCLASALLRLGSLQVSRLLARPVLTVLHLSKPAADSPPACLSLSLPTTGLTPPFFPLRRDQKLPPPPCYPAKPRYWYRTVRDSIHGLAPRPSQRPKGEATLPTHQLA